MKTETKAEELATLAEQIRFHTFRVIAQAGGGHFGGCLSIAEILAVLYFNVLRMDPKNPNDENRDFFILSKGHAGPALYVTMAMKGFFPLSELDALDKPLSNFPKHVDRLKLKGIELSTGPLGQGLSVACGMAIALKQQKRKNRVYILLSDGECNSGQVWEAAMSACKYGLDNLIAIIDRNGCQIDGRSDDVMPLEPLAQKFSSFGWEVFGAEGHDTSSLLQAFQRAKSSPSHPSIIIAKTVKGYGVSFMQDRYEWHSGSITQEQFETGMAELGKRV